MSARKKVISSIIVCGCIVLVGLFVWRVAAVNMKYPTQTLKSYEMGETANYLNTFELTVSDAKFLSDDEAEELFDAKSIFGDFEQEYLVATLTVKNISNEAQHFPLSVLSFQSGAFFNSAMFQFMEQFNGWSDVPELKPGEELEMKVPVNIPKSRFRESQWETVRQRGFEIVIALYPEKQVLKVNSIDSNPD